LPTPETSGFQTVFRGRSSAALQETLYTSNHPLSPVHILLQASPHPHKQLGRLYYHEDWFTTPASLDVVCQHRALFLAFVARNHSTHSDRSESTKASGLVLRGKALWDTQVEAGGVSYTDMTPNHWRAAFTDASISVLKFF